METSYSSYDYKKSIERVDEVLNSSDLNFIDSDSIPARSSLTFNNGYYVNISVLYVDIRGSKKLADNHKRPVLAKIYKTYISEVVAALKGNAGINEIYIEGDGIWGVFATPYKSDLDRLFSTAAQVASLVDILNIKFKKKNYSQINIGIGLAYGSSLYIKAGYKGSGINEVVWLGKVVGEAAMLCSYGNRNSSDKEIMVSSFFYDNLNDHNKSLLNWNSIRECYHGYVVNTDMDKWVQDNK